MDILHIYMWIVINQNTKRVAETIFLQTREERNLQPNQILIKLPNKALSNLTWETKIELEGLKPNKILINPVRPDQPSKVLINPN